jgi:PKD repeat protein
MVARLLRIAVGATALLALGAPAAARAASPPRFVTTQWLLRVPVGTPAGFIAKAVDPDGDAVTLAWTFDDGTVATGARVTKAWATPGAHTATVTATDATGLRATRTLGIEVTADPAAEADPAPGGVVLPRPGPPPGTTTVATPRLTIAGGALRLGRTGAIAVPVTCAAGADCAGRISLHRGGRRLATAAYAVRAGHAATVRLRVGAAVAARLRRRESTTVTVVVAPADGRPAVRTPRTLLSR